MATKHTCDRCGRELSCIAEYSGARLGVDVGVRWKVLVPTKVDEHGGMGAAPRDKDYCRECATELSDLLDRRPVEPD